MADAPADDYVRAGSPQSVGSLFTGIAGIDLGLERAGMRVSWQCEKDPAARRVLARHWPDVTTYDDVTTLKGSDVPAVDVLCGGFPCQDLSVAGGRAGLAGERSGLFFEFVRIAAEVAPRWVLIENVPGLLSSDDGRDMGIVLGTLADLGYGWCYRVLDAQYFGVAQRRRRVFIVGCLGDASRAAQVLLEPESCDGDPAPLRETREAVAGTLGGGSGSRGWAPDTDRMTFVPVTAATLTGGSAASPGVNPPGRRQEDDSNVLAFMWQAGGNNSASGAFEEDFTPTLPKSQTVAVAYSTKLHNTESNQAGKFYEEYTPGLQADSPPPAVAYLLAMRGRDDGAELEMGEEGLYNALRAGDGGSSRQNFVMAFSENQRGEVLETEYSRQITTGGGKPDQGYPAVRDGMAVRRLMPVECERLQGFPDGWTDAETDSARYRLLGNAVCVPVAEWIGLRIVEADRMAPAHNEDPSSGGH
jgi:DNA (cytosine-5)-methyltransferase 1